VSGDPIFLSARAAAAELGISLQTLYAYVSRGMVRSEPVPGAREKRYRAEDIRALKGRRIEPDRPAAAADTLAWGAPILDSALTLFADSKLYFRGADAAVLARTASLEDTATLLWAAPSDPFRDNAPPPGWERTGKLIQDLSDLDPVSRASAALSLAGALDPKAYNRSAEGLCSTSARIMRICAAAVACTGWQAGPIHLTLANGWGVGKNPAAVNAIRAALVLMADHELNVSAFTVRCVASARATLYASAIAGLGALSGPRHGATTHRVAAFTAAALVRQRPEDEVADRLQRGETLPGFGHPLYPSGDPRADAMFKAMEGAPEAAPYLTSVRRLCDAARELAGVYPTCDVALATLEQAFGLPRSAAISIFAAGRTAGWMAHAIEQHDDPALIRPRARYIGPPPR